MNSQKVEFATGVSDTMHGWTEMTVFTRNMYDELTSKTVIRVKRDCDFLDLSIEEYTGTTRRAKRTDVRLQKDAALALFKTLSTHFSWLGAISK